MESEHFVITGTHRINRRHCAIHIGLKHLGPSLNPDVVRNKFHTTFEVKWPWSGVLHYADVLEGYGPELKVELTKLIEDYTK